MFKTCLFKTWRKGGKSNIENSTDHFCEDTIDRTHWLPLQIDIALQQLPKLPIAANLPRRQEKDFAVLGRCPIY